MKRFVRCLMFTSFVFTLLIFISSCSPGISKQTPISTQNNGLTDKPVTSPIARPPETAAVFAFSSVINGQSDIFLGNTDGKIITNLTNDPANDSCPTYSPSGAQIAFCSDRNGKSQLFIMESNGTEQKMVSDQIPNCSCTPDRPIAWSPDGKWISLAGQMGQTGNMPTFDLFIIRSDGTKVVNLTKSPATIAGFTWNPDSKSILFIDASQPDILQGEVDRQKISKLFNQPITGIPSGYSPDGKYLLTWDGKSGTISLLSLSTSTPELIQISGGNGYDKYPAWSRDGQKILFMRRNGDSNDICLMNADGSGQVNLTSGSGLANYWPSISSDGKKIIYFAVQGNQWDTMIMNADGSGKTKVTDLIGVLGSISWKP